MRSGWLRLWRHGSIVWRLSWRERGWLLRRGGCYMALLWRCVGRAFDACTVFWDVEFRTIHPTAGDEKYGLRIGPVFWTRLVQGAAAWSSYHPLACNRSLTLWWLLGRQGASPASCGSGVRKEQGRFEAHAWVSTRRGGERWIDVGLRFATSRAFDRLHRICNSVDLLLRNKLEIAAMTTAIHHDQDFSWAMPYAQLLREGRLAEIGASTSPRNWKTWARLKNESWRVAWVMAHLLKWIFQPERRGNSWIATIKEQRQRIVRLLRKIPGLKSCLDEAFVNGYSDARLIAVRETNLRSGPFRKTRRSHWNRFWMMRVLAE